MLKNNYNESSLLKNKDFILLFLGGFVSRIGSGIHNIALIWFVLDLTGSGTTTGTILLLSTLPGVILGPFSGVVADRIDRKILIVGMDIIRGLIAIWLGWVIYTGSANMFHISLATVLIAICSTFFNPAITATLPNIVEDKNLQKANSMEHFSLNLTQIIGAALGGLLIALLGVSGVIILNGISFLISAISEMFINIPPIKRQEDHQFTFFNDLKFGVNFLYNSKGILSLFSIAIILNFLATGLFIIGLPFVFKEILKVSSQLFGISQSIFPAGAIIGALLLSIAPEIKNYFKVLISGIGIQSVNILLLGLPLLPVIMKNSSSLNVCIFLLFLLFFFGVINAVVNVPIHVLLQRLIPDDLRGRLFGLLGTLSQGLVPISIALTGFLLDRIEAYLLFMIAGILSLLTTIFAARIPALKGLKYTGQPDTCRVKAQ